MFRTEVVTSIELAFRKCGTTFPIILLGSGGLMNRFVTKLNATTSSTMTTTCLNAARAPLFRNYSTIAETVLTIRLLTNSGNLNSRPRVTVLLTILVRLAVTVTILVRTKNTKWLVLSTCLFSSLGRDPPAMTLSPVDRHRTSMSTVPVSISIYINRQLHCVLEATPVVMPLGLMQVMVVMNVGLRTSVSVRLRGPPPLPVMALVLVLILVSRCLPLTLGALRLTLVMVPATAAVVAVLVVARAIVTLLAFTFPLSYIGSSHSVGTPSMLIDG